MATYTKSARFTEQLPSTLVEPVVRKSIVRIAKARGVSIGQIQREALDRYLNEFYPNTSDELELHAELEVQAS